MTARARSTEEVRRGLTWRGSVRLGGGGPWFCPEVGPVAGVSRNPRPACQTLETPRCQREHTFPLAPSGLSARTSQPPRIQSPLLSGEHRKTDSLDLLPRALSPSPSGCTGFWNPRPLLFQENGKTSPRLNGRPRMKFLGLLPSGVQDPGS